MILTLLLCLGALALLAGLAYLVVCARIVRRFTRARRRRPRPHPGIDRRDRVQFPAADGRVLIRACYLPARPQRAAVVFVHGKDACRGAEMKAHKVELVLRLRAAGVSVLMLDLRGHGESGAARLTYGAREQFDVRGAVDFLVGRGYEPGRIGVLGASMGGSAALMAAASDARIGALMIDSAFADFAGMLELQYHKLSALPWHFLPGALLLARCVTGVALQRLRPIDAAPALCGRPTLVVHGSDDPLVPCSHARAIAVAARARLWVTASDRHLGSYALDPAAYSRIALRFFTSALFDRRGVRPTRATAPEPLRLAA